MDTQKDPEMYVLFYNSIQYIGAGNAIYNSTGVNMLPRTIYTNRISLYFDVTNGQTASPET